MWMLFFIAVGGALGAVSRYLLGLAVTSFIGAGFQPLATLIVNVTGSGIMGSFYALLGLGLITSDQLRGLVMIGFLGALTTFSSFSLDAVSLIEKGQIILGFAYVLCSVFLSLVVFYLVMILTRGIIAGH